MSEIRVNNITNRDGSTGTTVAGIPVVDSTSHFVVPSGNTAERGSRGRGLFGGGDTPADVNTIDYITIATLGNAVDFGDLTTGRRGISACSSSTRGIFAGSLGGNVIDYVTISSTGNAFDFGDFTENKFGPGGASNSIRGIFAGGYQPTGSIFTTGIEFITIASLGNASKFTDFADKNSGSGGFSSPTRAFFAGGSGAENVDNVYNTIQFLTIATLGNTQDFGDLTLARDFCSAFSNSVRGVIGGGDTENPSSGNFTNIIDYITIASTGDAQDFGDLSSTRERGAGCCNSTRGIFASGWTPAARQTTIEYVTISTTGDASDFGDITVARLEPGGLSDSHGGLG